MGRIKKAAQFLAPIFKENGWEWATLGNSNTTPSEKEIRDTLKRLKKDAKKCKGWACTGRLMAHWNHDFKRVEYLLEIPDKEE